MKGLQEKVVIVAGGATGIGAAASRRLGEEGSKVMVGDLNIAGAEAVADDINAAGGTAESFKFDISNEDDCRGLIQAAVDRWGAVQGLYNVAADLSQDNLGRDTDVVTVPIDVVRHTFDVNLMGFFFTSRHAIPAMLESGGGSIVHTTSAVVLGFPVFVAYGASKGGVIALSRHIAARWGKEGIRSNAIDPGITLTENQLEMVTDEQREEILPAVKSSDFGKPENVAASAVFLLSEDAAWINGQTYPVSSMEGAR
jgi:NAD(P)-dependent dehydrogenase (short-subunit alcohol dehydrogenase family)